MDIHAGIAECAITTDCDAHPSDAALQTATRFAGPATGGCKLACCRQIYRGKEPEFVALADEAYQALVLLYNSSDAQAALEKDLASAITSIEGTGVGATISIILKTVMTAVKQHATSEAGRDLMDKL